MQIPKMCRICVISKISSHDGSGSWRKQENDAFWELNIFLTCIIISLYCLYIPTTVRGVLQTRRAPSSSIIFSGAKHFIEGWDTNGEAYVPQCMRAPTQTSPTRAAEQLHSHKLRCGQRATPAHNCGTHSPQHWRLQRETLNTWKRQNAAVAESGEKHWTAIHHDRSHVRTVITAHTYKNTCANTVQVTNITYDLSSQSLIYLFMQKPLNESK